MRTKILLISTLALITIQLHSQTFEWAIAGDISAGSLYNAGKVIVTDAEMNSYIIGTFGDTLSIGGQEIVSLGASDIFIVKYNSNDEFQWLSTINSASSLVITKQTVAVDTDGNTYLCNLTADFTIDDTTFTPIGGNVIKFDSNDQLDWVKNNFGARVLTLDSSGDLIVSDVHIYSTVGDSTFTDFGAHLAKFDSDGNFIWVASIQGLTQAPSMVTCDPSDNIILSILGFGNTTIGGISIPLYDIGLAKFSSAGVFEWLQIGVGEGMDAPLDLKTNVNGDIFLLGQTSDSLFFGEVVAPLSSQGNYIFSFDSGGNPQWGTGTVNTIGTAIGVEPTGNVYFSGNTTAFGTAYFGESDSLAATLFTAFIVKYNSLGNVEWVKSAIGASCNDVHFAGGGDGAVFITGNFYSNIYFDDIFLEAGNGLATNNTFYAARIVQDGYVEVDEEITGLPFRIKLDQNYPNPFNPQTTISYVLPQPGYVSLSIYNVTGQVVETIVREYQTAGNHSIVWNAGHVSSGVYFYKITSGNNSLIRKCLIVK